LAGTKTRLGILPLGTLNHFSRDLRIPLKIEEAAALIGSGSVREVDVAEVNGRTFINNSAIGLYPLMVIDRDRRWCLRRGDSPGGQDPPQTEKPHRSIVHALVHENNHGGGC